MTLLEEAANGLGAVLLPVVAGLLFEELTFGGLVRLLIAPWPKTGKRTEHRVVEARGESDAMQYTLPLKQKQIEQSKLEAEARKEATIQNAQADAEAKVIDSKAELERRNLLAEAEAGRIKLLAAADAERI